MYLENYGVYKELVENKKMIIYSNSITSDNYNDHYNWILNIMKDSIETEYVRNVFITIIFDNGIDVELSIPDYWFNLIMWLPIIKIGDKVKPKHLFFSNNLRLDYIKKYLDSLFINIYRKKINNITLNNIIDDCISKYKDIDIFSFYLANTVNLYDFIKLMNENKNFNDLIHTDVSGVSVSEVGNVGLEKAKQSIDIIKNSDHCLSNFFKADEGVNTKQYKEVAINIGSKPDGRGGIYPYVINNNFLTGGVNEIIPYTIESSVGRTAQIIVWKNVGDSGHFARLLGLNNSDTFLNPDPNYVCNTKNFQKIDIKNKDILCRLKNRYYRLSPSSNSVEYKISENDKHLIGKTIYLRSPMTCESAANGHGICYRCYGDLAYTNNDINIGKIAAELLSSALTQRMLSAKHLLAAAVEALGWCKEFENFFTIDFNLIMFKDNLNLKNYKLSIDVESIDIENENDDDINIEFNEYIRDFDIINPKGEKINIHTNDLDKLYITISLNDLIRKKAEPEDKNIILDLDKLNGIPLFALQIHNNDLSKLLEKIKATIDNVKEMQNETRDSILQKLIEILIKGKLNVDSVHTEVVLMNQLRNVDNILEKPNWKYPNEPCNILSLKQSLSNHPSVTVSLSFQNINKTLYNPLTFKKNKASFMDLFFMKQPQEFMNSKYYNSNKKEKKYNKNEIVNVFKRTK